MEKDGSNQFKKTLGRLRLLHIRPPHLSVYLVSFMQALGDYNIYCFQPHTNHYINFSIGTNITSQQYYDLRNIFQAKQVQIRVYSGRDESRPFAIGSRVPQRTSTTTQTTVTRNSETVSQVRPMLQMMAYTPHPLLAFFNAAFQDRHLSFCRQLCHMCVLTTVTRIFTSFLEFALYRLKKQSEQG